MNQSIEQSKSTIEKKILEEVVNEHYSEAIEVIKFSPCDAPIHPILSLCFQMYSRLIEASINQPNNSDVPSLLAQRAGVFLLSKQYDGNFFTSSLPCIFHWSLDALLDTKKALELDNTLLYAYINE